MLTGLDTSAGEGVDAGSEQHSMYVHVCMYICICDISGIIVTVTFLEEHVSVPWFEHRADFLPSSSGLAFPQSVHKRNFSLSGE